MLLANFWKKLLFSSPLRHVFLHFPKKMSNSTKKIATVFPFFEFLDFPNRSSSAYRTEKSVFPPPCKRSHMHMCTYFKHGKHFSGNKKAPYSGHENQKKNQV